MALRIAQWLSLLLSAANGQSDLELCKSGYRSFSGFAGVRQGGLFYWYFEPAAAATDAPLILWLQGGPGATSMLGNFFELGPFTLRPDGSLQPRAANETWASLAPVIFVDSPVGTGWSWAAENSYAKSQEEVAAGLRELLEVFVARHPHVAHRRLVLAGESYGGHFIPALGASFLEKPGASWQVAKSCEYTEKPEKPEKPEDPNPPAPRAKDEVFEEIRNVLNMNSALQIQFFDARVRQHLHALLGSGGRQRLNGGLSFVHTCTMNKKRQDVKNWPAYLVTLLKKFDMDTQKEAPELRLGPALSSVSTTPEKAEPLASEDCEDFRTLDFAGLLASDSEDEPASPEAEARQEEPRWDLRAPRVTAPPPKASGCGSLDFREEMQGHPREVQGPVGLERLERLCKGNAMESNPLLSHPFGMGGPGTSVLPNGPGLMMGQSMPFMGQTMGGQSMGQSMAGMGLRMGNVGNANLRMDMGMTGTSFPKRQSHHPEIVAR
ncbi:unnamed protein product [Effrenium voratum]|nr:unnamed protein product [Effrenium voratum]